MSSLSGVVLHTGQGSSLGGYLFRVILHLLAAVGVGVTVHWCVRTVETVRSENGERGSVEDDEP
jgi:recombinational DNA repair protein (RecF pathway)